MPEASASLDIPMITVVLLVLGGLAHAVGMVVGHVAVYVAGEGEFLGDPVVRTTGTLVLQSGTIIAGMGMLWAAWQARPSIGWFRIVYLFLALSMLFRGGV